MTYCRYTCPARKLVLVEAWCVFGNLSPSLRIWRWRERRTHSIGDFEKMASAHHETAFHRYLTLTKSYQCSIVQFFIIQLPETQTGRTFLATMQRNQIILICNWLALMLLVWSIQTIYTRLSIQGPPPLDTRFQKVGEKISPFVWTGEKFIPQGIANLCYSAFRRANTRFRKSEQKKSNVFCSNIINSPIMYSTSSFQNLLLHLRFGICHSCIPHTITNTYPI